MRGDTPRSPRAGGAAYGSGKIVPRRRSEAVVTERTKITLDESEIPRQWYNMITDLPAPPPPPLHPGTGQPVGPEDLAPLFPMELIRQEVATDSYIAVPDEVLDVYRL